MSWFRIRDAVVLLSWDCPILGCVNVAYKKQPKCYPLLYYFLKSILTLESVMRYMSFLLTGIAPGPISRNMIGRS